MQTPEEFAWDLRYASQHRTSLDIADLIRARDAEVRVATLREFRYERRPNVVDETDDHDAYVDGWKRRLVGPWEPEP